MNAPATLPSGSGKVRAARFRAAWRWHFYSGLFVAPVLILLCLTGAIYLFDREIDGWWTRDLAAVTTRGVPAPLAEQQAIVRAAAPGAAITRVSLPRSADRAHEWTVRTAEGTRLLFVDPYARRVVGRSDPGLHPTEIARDLHGNLLAGDGGSYIVELTACWTLVMIATGVYLWWPRRWRIAGVFAPRLAARDRVRWRDLHAMPAAMLSLLLAGLVVTGLPWSVFWGDRLARVGGVVAPLAPSPNFAAHAPIAGLGAAPAAGHPRHAEGGMSWTIAHSAPPTGSGGTASGVAGAERALGMLDRARWGEGVKVFYPSGPDGVFTVSHVPDKAQGQRTLYVDPGTGRVLRDIGWDQYSPAARAIEWGVETHVGRQYGFANQLANLAVVLLFVGAVVAGLVLWWRRRPEGELGAPAADPGARLGPGLLALLVALAILFPLLGASTLLVLLAERLVLRRLPGLGRWLGLRPIVA